MPFICIMIRSDFNIYIQVVMSEDNMPAGRRKRVNFIKGCLVTLFLVMIITPIIISAVSLSYVKKLNRSVDELNDRISKLELTYMLKSEADEGLSQLNQEKANRDLETKELLAEPEEPLIQEIDEALPGKKVYLTFDDGPSPNTEKILDILDEYDVKATFFVTGYQAEKHPEWYKEIVDRGHTIGMHSYSHVYSDIYSSTDAFFADIDKLHDYILENTGVDSHYLRFPGGSSNRVSRVSMSELCTMVTDREWIYYDWNISSQDATSPSPGKDRIKANVLAGIGEHDSSIILMHDATEKNATVQALPEIIQGIQAMEDTVILPIDDKTEKIRHLSPVFEEDDINDTED